MTRAILTKRIIQAVAAAFGLLGALFVYIGAYAGIPTVLKSDYAALLYMVLPFTAFGVIVLAIAWLNLRHFGPRSIRHLTALVLVLIYLWSLGWFHVLIERLEQTATNPMIGLLVAALDVLSLLVLYWSYCALSRKLIQLTGAADRCPDDLTLLPDPASDPPSRQQL